MDAREESYKRPDATRPQMFPGPHTGPEERK